jgi:two-component sensor histidine kinase
VINAIKHAFAADPAGGLIVVSYENEDAGWRLAVADNGVGRPHRDPEAATPGLGTGIVEALARQFDARVETSTGSNGIGTMVSITHGQLTSHGAAAHRAQAGMVAGADNGQSGVARLLPLAIPHR